MSTLLGARSSTSAPSPPSSGYSSGLPGRTARRIGLSRNASASADLTLAGGERSRLVTSEQ
jgi:hypothetical protein